MAFTAAARAASPLWKYCPKCKEKKSIDDFGIVRARRDGRNLYCKLCVRERIRAMRANLQTLPEQIKQKPKNPIHARILGNTPRERVLRAIKLGACTQKEIAQLTKLPRDKICDQLAQLLLWSREIRTGIRGGVRIYFVNPAALKLTRK
jgi:hypothetical protein